MYRKIDGKGGTMKTKKGIDLKVVLTKEYKKKLRKYHLGRYKNEITLGISHADTEKAYILIDRIAKNTKKSPEPFFSQDLIARINECCVHELIHLSSKGCKPQRNLPEEKVEFFGKLLTVYINYIKEE
jgi:hypothetical protein